MSKLLAAIRLRVTTMAYTPKQAMNLITPQAEEIALNLAKIICHMPSTTDQEWYDEIKNKHVAEIRRKANKINGGKKLKAVDIAAILVGAFGTQDLPSYVELVYTSTQYKRKAKIVPAAESARVRAVFLQMAEYVEEHSLYLANIFRDNNWENDKTIAAFFTSKVKELRDLI